MSSPLTELEKTTALPGVILESERAVIRKRRGAAGLQQDRAELTGLAISGGGIRSSTFSIGVIQALAERDLFKQFDYLSTVSGGGYTGSLLSSLLNHNCEQPDQFPLHKPVGKEEPKALQHIRNGSNYLTPGGFLSVARLPAVLLRGLLLNLLLLLPFAMLAVIFTELVHESLPRLNLSGAFAGNDVAAFVTGVMIGGVAYFSLSGWRSAGGNWERRNAYELWVARVLILLVAILLFGPLSVLIEWAIYEPWIDFREVLAERLPLIVWAVAVALVTVVIVIMRAPGNLRSLLSRLALVLAGLLGPTLVFGMYLVMVIAQVDSPFISFGRPLSALQTGLETEELEAKGGPVDLRLDQSFLRAMYLKGIEYPHYENENTEQTLTESGIYCGADTWLLPNPESGLGPPTQADCAVPPEELDARQEAYGFLRLQPREWWPYALEDPVTEEVPLYELFGARLGLGGERSETALLHDYEFVLLTAILFVLNYYFINVNQTSLHSFYRDRLSKTYLIRRDAEGRVQQNDELKLSELNAEGSYAPYHLINTSLNLQAATVESQRGRSSDFFCMSRLYCGGTQTGYCRTEDLEQQDGHLNLGTAMAISGAAAAPNMGSATVRSLVFVLTLLNVRLGYWIPNPAFVAQGKRVGRPWARYLSREAFGNLTAETRLVNISDGGHLENLAIYELLRRHCNTILCIDGEADPDHSFHGLVTLMRIARIDLGIEIEIDLSDLQLQQGLVSKHYTVGRINYGDGVEPGTLIYVKSSVSEASDRNPFLHKYRNENASFPHESTSDQFFDERQFEAYRALGECIGRGLARDLEQGKVFGHS